MENRASLKFSVIIPAFNMKEIQNYGIYACI